MKTELFQRKLIEASRRVPSIGQECFAPPRQDGRKEQAKKPQKTALRIIAISALFKNTDGPQTSRHRLICSSDSRPAVRRISAPDVEVAVRGCIDQLLNDLPLIRGIAEAVTCDATSIQDAFERAGDLTSKLTDGSHRRMLIKRLVRQVRLLGDEVEVMIDHAAFEQLLGLSGSSEPSEPIVRSVAMARVRVGKQVKLVLGDEPSLRNDALIKLVSDARAVRELVMSQPNQSIKDIAAQAGQCRVRFTKLLKLSWLAPSIVQAILSGRQPLKLTATNLLTTKLPMGWAAQQAALGFD